jgi:hypothetical protein
MWKDSIEIIDLAAEVKGYGDPNDFRMVRTTAFAYRSAHRLDSLEKKYIEFGQPHKSGLDIYVLRLSEKAIQREIGVEFHFEPDFESDDSHKVIGFIPILRPSFTPLSDVYYRIVQDFYYTLEARGHSFGDIGHHVMDYMSWASASWDEVFTD